MTGKVYHRFVSAVSDVADATLVRPQTNWNDTHDLYADAVTRTAATDAIAASDLATHITYNRASSIAVSLPAAQGGAITPGALGFFKGWFCWIYNIGIGDVVITPASGTILGNPSLTLKTGQGFILVSNGANYDGIPTGAAPLLSPAFGGTPTAPTAATDTNTTQIATTEFVHKQLGPLDCGRVSYVSATQVKFAPFNGDKIKIQGVWYSIGSAGVSIANTGVIINGTGGQNLAASTAYLLGLLVSGGTLLPYFSTTITHSASSTAGNVGTEILNGLDTVSVIGMVRTNAGAQFQDSISVRGVASWFNRRRVAVAVNIANGNTTSTTFVNMGAGPSFLNWGDNVDVQYAGVLTSSIGGNYGQVQVKDDLSVVPVQTTSFADGRNNSAAGIGSYSPTEGFRTLSMWALSQASGNTFTTANNIINAQVTI